MARIKTDLRNKNAQDVLSMGRVVLLGMTGAPEFPTPYPSMATLAAACDALQSSILELEGGGSRAAYATKDKRLNELGNILRGLAGYVGAVANGNEHIIAKSGFSVARRSTRITSMDAPAQLTAKSGTQPCTIKVSWKPVKGARYYNLYICKGDMREEANWILLRQTSSSRYLATDLNPLEYYAFRVVACGAHAGSPVSGLATALSIGRKAA